MVDIVSYCLLPNHFHFVLKQKVEGGIAKFMSKLGNSYVKFFNQKHKRVGGLFQGRFKASVLALDGSLERTSAYVNTNYKHHKIDPKKALVKTSLFEFLGTEMGNSVCNEKEVDLIINSSGGTTQYKASLKAYKQEFSALKAAEK